MNLVSRTVVERLPVFSRFVDKDRISLPLRSPKRFTLGAIYDGTRALLVSVTEGDYEQKLVHAAEFWENVAANMPLWGQVEAGDLKPAELRQEYIHTHAVILWALGAMGRTLNSAHPDDSQKALATLRPLDWRRTNREWQGVAMSGSDVVDRRESRMDTASFFKCNPGLALAPGEERSLKGAQQVMDDLKDLIAAH